MVAARKQQSKPSKPGRPAPASARATSGGSARMTTRSGQQRIPINISTMTLDQTEAKAEAKDEAKAEAKAEVETEAKDDSHVEAKAKDDSHVEAKDKDDSHVEAKDKDDSHVKAKAKDSELSSESEESDVEWLRDANPHTKANDKVEAEKAEAKQGYIDLAIHMADPEWKPVWVNAAAPVQEDGNVIVADCDASDEGIVGREIPKDELIPVCGIDAEDLKEIVLFALVQNWSSIAYYGYQNAKNEDQKNMMTLSMRPGAISTLANQDSSKYLAKMCAVVGSTGVGGLDAEKVAQLFIQLTKRQVFDESDLDNTDAFHTRLCRALYDFLFDNRTNDLGKARNRSEDVDYAELCKQLLQEKESCKDRPEAEAKVETETKAEAKVETETKAEDNLEAKAEAEKAKDSAKESPTETAVSSETDFDDQMAQKKKALDEINEKIKVAKLEAEKRRKAEEQREKLEAEKRRIAEEQREKLATADKALEKAQEVLDALLGGVEVARSARADPVSKEAGAEPVSEEAGAVQCNETDENKPSGNNNNNVDDSSSSSTSSSSSSTSSSSDSDSDSSSSQATVSEVVEIVDPPPPPPPSCVYPLVYSVDGERVERTCGLPATKKMQGAQSKSYACFKDGYPGKFDALHMQGMAGGNMCNQCEKFAVTAITAAVHCGVTTGTLETAYAAHSAKMSAYAGCSSDDTLTMLLALENLTSTVEDRVGGPKAQTKMFTKAEAEKIKSEKKAMKAETKAKKEKEQSQKKAEREEKKAQRAQDAKAAAAKKAKKAKKANASLLVTSSPPSNEAKKANKKRKREEGAEAASKKARKAAKKADKKRKREEAAATVKPQ